MSYLTTLASAVVAQFLESSEYQAQEGESKVLHHYSQSDHDDFHPLSHFGTAKAARDRSISGTYPGRVSRPVTYSVRLKMGNVHHMNSDLGDHDPKSLLHHLHNEGVFNSKEFQEHEGHMPYHKNNKAESDYSNKYLADKLRDKGIHTLSYKNDSEDPGSTSYIITHPSQVRVLKTSVNAKINYDRTTDN